MCTWKARGSFAAVGRQELLIPCVSILLLRCNLGLSVRSPTSLSVEERGSMKPSGSEAVRKPRTDDRPLYDALLGGFVYQALLVAHDLKLFRFLA